MQSLAGEDPRKPNVLLGRTIKKRDPPMQLSRLVKRTIKVALYAISVIAIVAVAGVVYYFTTLYTAGPQQQGYLVLTGATVLVGEELESRSGMTVLIRDGIIIQVSQANEIDIPSEAVTLDLSGYTLIPGLIDLHVHLGAPELDVGQEFGPTGMPRLFLDFIRFYPGKRRSFFSHGVTTVRSLGDDYAWIMDARRMLRAGELEGPRLYAAGPMFTTPGGHPVVTIGVDSESDSLRLPSTPDEARRAVQELARGDNRVDLIKVIQERGSPERPLQPIAPEVLRAIVEEAHQHGLPVVAHWGTLQDLQDLLAAGVDGLEHLEARGGLESWPEDVLQSLVDRKVSITPTLAVVEAATLRPRSPLPPHVMQKPKERVGEFHNAGGRVVVGSDAGMPGVLAGRGVHRELELLVASGLTPREALRAATSEAAKVLRNDRIGAILPGRAADLVVINGNPLQQIQAARNVMMVFRDGRIVVDHRR
jgi:imidazolonepropionase-like amidohydrolase